MYNGDVNSAVGTSADCNDNALPDDCDIASGSSDDCDADGVPDECVDGCSAECRCLDGLFCTLDSCAAGVCSNTPHLYGDVNESGIVDLDDILCVISGFGSPGACPGADIANCNPDGVVELDDILAVIGAFAGFDPCCGGG